MTRLRDGIKKGLNCVLTDNMDNPAFDLGPRFADQASVPAAPVCRQPDAKQSAVVVNSTYFSDRLDRLIVSEDYPYEDWSPVSQALMKSFRFAYGKDNSVIPTCDLQRREGYFISRSKDLVYAWLKERGRNTTQERFRYRALIQQMVWTRVGDLDRRVFASAMPESADIGAPAL